MPVANQTRPARSLGSRTKIGINGERMADELRLTGLSPGIDSRPELWRCNVQAGDYRAWLPLTRPICERGRPRITCLMRGAGPEAAERVKRVA